MSLSIFVGYRVYTNTVNLSVGSFTFFSIKNNGIANIELRQNFSDTNPNIFIVKPNESFSFPIVGSNYEFVFINSGGSQYSILTDGVINTI